MAAKYTPDMKRFKKIEKSYNIAPKSRLGTPCKTISSLTPALGRRSKSSSNITCTPTSITNKSYHHTPKNSRKQINVIETPEYFNTVTIGTPRRFTKSTSDILSDSNENQLDNEDEISNLKVAIRVRPMSVKECSNVRVKNVISCKENEVTVSSGVTADGMSGVTHSFQYDYVFSSCDIEDPNYADQKYVFNTLAAPLVDWCLKGYNVCLFAYGQTGSGKSYSMMGIDSDDPDEIGVEAGITPRFCKEIFNRIEVLKEKYFIEVEVSYFEIYNEKIHDLLTLSSEEGFINFDNTNKKSALKVREHPVFGPYVVDLSTHVVDSYKLLRDWIAVGNSQRATASTGMNDKSSRSHSIFNIVLNLTEKTSTRDENEVKLTKRSKISLVDLAGSERVCHTNVSAERLKEGVSINKSLLTLGKVIAALAETKKPNNFVPYRESVLTWLLRVCIYFFLYHHTYINDFKILRELC
uniref:Kinesin-like protein n=1 Tax=Culicoides sonorensis TaxID=179676 RepID=A0A336LQJ9_CULSO